MANRQPAVRPALRGYIHLGAAFVAPFALVWLVFRADSPAEYATAAVFGAGMILLFAASSAYHLPPWPPPARAIARRVDHASIFLFVAAAYTPFCMVALPPAWGIPLQTAVGGLALCGAVLKLAWPGLPRWVNLGAYAGLGWAALVATPVMVEHMSLAGIALLVAAGVTYTAGGLVHALRRPDPLPRWFGHHEVFHAATVVGTVLLFVVVDMQVFRG